MTYTLDFQTNGYIITDNNPTGFQRLIPTESVIMAIDYCTCRKPSADIPPGVGVFTYEDPDRTGLGDALGDLVAHDILLRTQARSLGVLMFTGGLAPSRPGGLGYFDKIEKVAAAQQVYLAVWGAVRKIGSELLIETYVQVPESTADRDLAAEVSIPEPGQALKKLTARLRPDRFAVQRYRIPAEDADAISSAAKRIGELRSEPRQNAAVNAVLPGLNSLAVPAVKSLVPPM